MQYISLLKSLIRPGHGSNQRHLNEKTGNCTLILYKTNGQCAVLNAYYAPFPLSTWDAYFTSIWWAEPMLFVFVSLLIHRVIYTSLWTSQTSADHEQGVWSATGARSLVKRCAHFIVPLLGNAQFGIAYFLSTRNNPYFSKISFAKLIPLIQKILRL